MVRLKWVKTLVATFAWAGMAWGQQPSIPANLPIGATEHFMTLREAGKQEQNCRILRSWQRADGNSAYEVQNVDTGERLTVVETHTDLKNKGPLRTVSTRIFHWHNRMTPPSGVPVPVEEAKIVANASTGPVANSTKPTEKIEKFEASTSLRGVEKADAVDLGAPPKVLLMSLDSKSMAEKHDAESKSSAKLEPARLTDWHRSWGKADDHKSKKLVEEVELPRAGKMSDDPLKNPEPYCKPDLAKILTGAKDLKSDKDLDKPKDKKADSAEKAPELKKELGLNIPTMPAWKGSGVVQTAYHPDVESSNSSTYSNLPPLKPQPLPPSVIAASQQGSTTTVHAASETGHGFRGFFRKKHFSKTSEDGSTEVQSTEIPGQSFPVVPGSVSVQAAGPDVAESVYFVPVPNTDIPSIRQVPAQAPPASTAPQANAPSEEDNAFSAPRIAPSSRRRLATGNAFSSPTSATPGEGQSGTFSSPWKESQDNRAMVSSYPVTRPDVVSGPYTGPLPPNPIKNSGRLDYQTVQGMLAMVQKGASEQQRAWAAQMLAGANWRNNPEIVEVLLQAAREDVSPIVRVRCIQSLGSMNVQGDVTLAALQTLKTDANPDIRQAANTTLQVLGQSSGSPSR